MKAVRIADLKSHLSEHLRVVRRGQSLTVLDRDTPIALIIPAGDTKQALRIRRPPPGGPKPSEVHVPPPLPAGTDAVALLLEDRKRGR